jgi:16S rRNA (cytosine1402-N4)-methyltransferase
MVAEVVAALVGNPDGWYLDGTLGDAGHAKAILGKLGPGGGVFGVDRDPAALARAQLELAAAGPRALCRLGNFCDLPDLLPASVRGCIQGILLDLGLRSGALDDPSRGFTFRGEGPLDMRFDPRSGQSAADLLGRIKPRDLVRVLEEGTTRASPRAIAQAIIGGRRGMRMRTTGDLVRCLRRALGRRVTPKLLASVFAALRMEVNQELQSLEQALAVLPPLLQTGGVLCVLSYQSQEDRRVKRLRQARLRDPVSGEDFRMEPLSRKPLRPAPEESARNPRAKSARLRAFRRIPIPAAT